MRHFLGGNVIVAKFRAPTPNTNPRRQPHHRTWTVDGWVLTEFLPYVPWSGCGNFDIVLNHFTPKNPPKNACLSALYL